MTEANVALLIDYENVGLDSIQYLLDQISDVGRVIIKRAYADWSAQGGKRDQLLELRARVLGAVLNDVPAGRDGTTSGPPSLERTPAISASP